MSATSAPTGRGLDQRTSGPSGAIRHDVAEHGRRLSTETKSAFKTTEFVAYVVVLAGILIAGAITKASSYGANHDPFRSDRVMAVRDSSDCRIHDQPWDRQGRQPPAPRRKDLTTKA